MSTVAYYWSTIACLLAFIAVCLCVLWDQGKLRRRQDELAARVDALDPLPERGRHRKTSTGATAVSAIDFDSDGGD